MLWVTFRSLIILDVSMTRNIQLRWEDPTDDNRHTDWAKELYEAMTPYSTSGVAINFMSGDEADRVRAPYGDRIYERLYKSRPSGSRERLPPESEH